jgi:hypothetical protein
MSANDCKAAKNKCCYIYRQGQLKGNKCSNFVSKRDDTHSMCSQHYYRFNNRVKETITNGSDRLDKTKEIPSNVDIPTNVDVKKTSKIEKKSEVINNKESQFEERFRNEQREENEYREWRLKRLISNVLVLD